MSSPRTALILAGHGSHISPHTAGLVWHHVDELRALRVADEVTATFWKEMPSFHAVFNSLDARDITVVPLFTAQGYFTQTVIPAEMGLTGPITQRDGRTIRYARTLSEHPYLGGVVRRRIEDALCLMSRNGETPREQTAVAIIGHSTRRSPESRRAAEAQAQAVRDSGLAGEVVAVYLDDEPQIRSVYDLTSAPNLIAVPYFLALGSHTTLDVPRELGLPAQSGPGQAAGGTVQGRAVYYTPPVGIEDDLRAAILELAREAGAPLNPPAHGSPWDCFPSRMPASLWEMVTQAGALRLGQLRLTATEVTHWDDDNPTETITDPGELRRRVRENPFRSLATSADLPRGWRVPNDRHRLHAIIETIYPGALGDMLACESGAVSPFEATIARQTGQYRALDGLDSAQQGEVVARVCGGCVRHPAWFSTANYLSSTLLCPEPCNHWLSAALNEPQGEVEE